MRLRKEKRKEENTNQQKSKGEKKQDTN